jgi:Icc-related predicted phosphoesterase
LNHRQEKLVYEGYPFTDDSEIKQQLQMTNPNPVLMLTHMGPAHVGTVDINRTPENAVNTRIQSGSHSILDVVVKVKPTLLIHGHSHYSWGMSQLGSTTIINPGPLQRGRYAIVHLNQLDGKWLLKSVAFETLTAIEKSNA